MRIRRIEAIGISVPLAKPVKMSLEEVRAANNLLVRLELEGGAVGWGEAASAPTMTGETLAGMVAAVRHLAPRLEGLEADDIAGVMARADLHLYGNPAAKSAIEMALHDALGRARGRPAYELLGGRLRERVPLLRLIGTGKGTAADVEEALAWKARGYVAFKVKVGVGAPAEDAARTRSVLEALGDPELFCADANQGYTPAQAIEYARALDGMRLDFFEQPVAAHDLEGMARVARESGLRLGADEGLHSIEDLRRHHELGAAHGGSLKTIKMGGMRPVCEAARLCERLGLKVNLACKMAETGIGAAGLLQVAAAVPALDWAVSLTNDCLSDDVLAAPLRYEGGHAAIPRGPGLGVEVDEAKVRRYAREA